MSVREDSGQLSKIQRHTLKEKALTAERAEKINTQYKISEFAFSADFAFLTLRSLRLRFNAFTAEDARIRKDAEGAEINKRI